jgi:hypothetical protein
VSPVQETDSEEAKKPGINNIDLLKIFHMASNR